MGFLEWLVGILLKLLVNRGIAEAEKQAKIIKRDAERNEVNDLNTKKYLEAETRLERVKSAKDLLNGTRSE
jgi:hypothetical protein